MTGTQGATVVAEVGGQSAANVAAGASAANAAVADAMTANTMVKRDANGGFWGNNITANQLYWGFGAYLRSELGGVIELGDSSFMGAVPYIDFHYGHGSFQDYNVRLINMAENTLSVFSAQNVSTPVMSIGPGRRYHHRQL